MDRREFIALRNRFLTAAQPIQSIEYLKGRERVQTRLSDALQSPGRHAFIYGYRGVGKSSLAQTVAFSLQDDTRSPVLTSCAEGSTFASVMKAVCSKALKAEVYGEGNNTYAVGANLAGLGGVNFSKGSQPSIPFPEIDSPDRAADLLHHAAKTDGATLFVLVDEFEWFTEAGERKKFASLLKQISDQHIQVRFILCGIADSVEGLFDAHESVFRQMHTEKLDRLELQPRLDIINAAASALQMTVPDGYKFRVAQISDGFPSFVHLLAEKILTATYDADRTLVTPVDYDDGLRQAISSVGVTLGNTYDNTLHRNTKKYEHAIWAVASSNMLVVSVDEVWRRYEEIVKELNVKAVSRKNINTKLVQLTGKDYGPLLKKPRRSNYEFKEKMMRAYARLRAEEAGMQLGVDASSEHGH